MSQIHAGSGAAPRVLLVESSPARLRAIRSQLVAGGFEIHEAAAADPGWELARSLLPDLILLGLELPDRHGFDALRRLKDDPVTRSIPVVFLAERASCRDTVRGLDLGAVDFLARPCDAPELRARVRAAVRTKYLQDLLHARAQLDGLTGLGNRYALDERLAASWQLCRRRGSPLTVMLADLDHFKRVNDEHDHAIGDEVLRRTAQILRASVRGCDFVARYGGEEFVLVAPDCDLDGAVTMAERFRRELSGPDGAARGLVPYPITTSVGLAEAGAPEDSSPELLLGRADRALYRAKAAGRDAVWCWDGAQNRPAPACSLSRSGLLGSLGIA